MKSTLSFLYLFLIFLEACLSVSPSLVESVNRKQSFWHASLNSKIANLEIEAVKRSLGYKVDKDMREKILFQKDIENER